MCRCRRFFSLFVLAAMVLAACKPVMPVEADTPAEPAQTRITLSNQAPIVEAGATQTITLPGVALLDGTVLDDVHPNSPGVVTTTWSVIDGAGVVTFTNAAAVDTAVSISAPGIYTLRLTADDGEFAVSDQRGNRDHQNGQKGRPHGLLGGKTHENQQGNQQEPPAKPGKSCADADQNTTGH